jgi:hypothetical protein
MLLYVRRRNPAQLRPRSIPEASKLTFGNVLIDTDLLLPWRWFQLHLLLSGLTITMADVVIFDELALEDFASSLNLNVALIYDYRITGYFDRSEWFHRWKSRIGGWLLTPKGSIT